MRHKVAAAPLRGAFFLTQHLVAPPPAVLYLVVLHLVPRSAGHTTCSGLRPTISSGRRSADLLHLAPPPAVLYLVYMDRGTYYI